ncbi:pseudouridine synthase [Crucibulum laeve]|uniref:tRNA pseudouridine(55) synthase n=1 Tax=Crucibulum laeve TaxID=68775 RepID=A0A5C3MMY0_9AGAR|nr:pseudouridine synthase [Crucibulum laeve]
MPKVSLSSLPISGLFGVVKPSGPTSMSIIHDLQQLVARSKLFADEEKLEKIKGKKIQHKSRGKRGREAIKIGQGGTLDPLADGVLVIGVGKGTKKLSDFLNCTKEYSTTCLLGCETDTYDSEGSRMRVAPWRHVTREKVEAALAQFTGEIMQTPPIFSALKMDGMPLYDYARKGIPLPRPIEPRKVVIHSLELVEWKGTDHSFSWPTKIFSDEDKKAVETALHGAGEDISLKDEPETEAADETPAAFVLKMKVSGGTYVRSIVHDLAHAVGSAGHVVTLTRSRQGRFVFEPTEEGDRACVPWEVFEKGLKDSEDVDEDGWKEWEREVIDRLEIVDGKK